MWLNSPRHFSRERRGRRVQKQRLQELQEKRGSSSKNGMVIKSCGGDAFATSSVSPTPVHLLTRLQRFSGGASEASSTSCFRFRSASHSVIFMHLKRERVWSM